MSRTVHPPERGPYSNAEVERALAQHQGGPRISANYLYQLRSGLKDNPTKRNREALVRFFGVDPAYFFDDGSGRATFADLELLAALRNSIEVRQLALCALELDPAMRRWLAQAIQEMPSGRSRRRGPGGRHR
ncbi:MAG: XRE family transcriptional regulator [Pseudonocardiaceae bacterium]